MKSAADRVVYQSRATKPSGSVVRYTMHGIKHRHITIGGKYRTQILINGAWRTVMNHELPVSKHDTGQYIAHPHDGLCRKCGHIYTELMSNAGHPCGECRIERMARRGEMIQQMLGVDLGWHTIDHEGNRERWGFKDQVPRNRPLRSAYIRR